MRNDDFCKIVEDLNKLGINKGDKVLIHSSYKSLGGVEGGPDTLFDALQEAVGEYGILMFPTFTYAVCNARNPVFDVKSTRSHSGALPELFRHREGVRRSVHPTHSLAVWGNDKDYYVDRHYEDNVCVAENSPIIKLKNNGGKILMLGCGITHNTLIHGAECYTRAPYAFQVDYSEPEFYREYVTIDENDTVRRQEFFHEFMEPYGYNQDYGKLANVMDIPKGYILKSESYLMDAKEVWDTVLATMEKEPYYFVSKQIN